ncbi:hypothetical protein IE53DRAFT_384968 [Violaceomyces palustris]|uniref:Uncharacterized protein n=1 Tax=Violaceomyces palustris TaxID=1673888 RepID=A0ACD0P3D6_9BASI|nr:hypothetical protein IE53DRAFT_384968 [Violaceomyces palustris]
MVKKSFLSLSLSPSLSDLKRFEGSVKRVIRSFPLFRLVSLGWDAGRRRARARILRESSPTATFLPLSLSPSAPRPFWIGDSDLLASWILTFVMFLPTLIRLP